MKKVKREPYYCEERQSWVIHLSTGHAVLIDEEDAELLSRYCWTAVFNSQGKIPYARAIVDGKHVRMHRMLLNAPKDMQVDHVNGNSLDNRKENLRLCTNRENSQNRSLHRSGKLAGGTFDKNRNRWKSQLRLGLKTITIGYYKTELEAHQAYKEKIEELGLT